MEIVLSFWNVLPQVVAGDVSETLAWWDHLAASVLVALVVSGLIRSVHQHRF